MNNQVQAILNLYSTPNSFIKVFNPLLQDRLYEDKERVFFGRAPILEYVAQAYSKELVISCLIDQYEYMKSKVTVRQLDIRQLEELSLLTFIASKKLKQAKYSTLFLMLDWVNMGTSLEL